MPARWASSEMESCACFLVPTKRTCPPLRHDIDHKFVGLFEKAHGFLEIDDVNPVARAEDVLFHLRVPALGLMTKVDPRFQQLLHRYG